MRINSLIFLMTILASGSWVYAQTADAVVVSVRGRAVVRKMKGTETKLLKKGDRLFAGQRVSCADGCKELVISYCNVKIPVPRSAKGKLIVSISCNAQDGERAGRPKGEGVSIISPTGSELIQPEAFVFRWKPSESPLKLTLKVHLGEKLWGPEIVDGSKGSFTSDDLIAALKHAQKVGNLHLVIVLDDGSEPSPVVKFNLVSEADQQNMIEKLKVFADETNEVLKALGRGMVFSAYELHSEAVVEFEKALAISQALQSGTKNLMVLRRIAIRANYKAYNDERVRQLCSSSKFPVSRLTAVCFKDSQ